LDSVGGASGSVIGSKVTISGGEAAFNDPNQGAVSAVQLPANILRPNAQSGATAFSVEMWATTSKTNAFSGYCPRLYQFGFSGTNDNSFGISRAPCWPGIGYLNALITGASGCTTNSKVLFNGLSNTHVVITYALGGPTNFYVNRALIMNCPGVISQSNYDIVTSTETNYLGRSLYGGDTGLAGSINEFRIWNGELSASMVIANMNAGANDLYR
jgi:hypothetical protein